MKKVFVSVPIVGRTEDDIRGSMKAMHMIAQATVGQELEMIESYIDGDEARNGCKELYTLGLRISAMQVADYYIGIDESYMFRETMIEREVAAYYKIPMITCKAEFVCGDIKIDPNMIPVFEEK